MADAVLRTADARTKTALSRRHAATWFAAREAGDAPAIGTASPPDRPARPDRPKLLDPRDVPRRRPGSAKGRRAILHAVAHIELNAVDLHWDVIARFSHVPMPIGFFDDWVRAADEESKHFNLVADVLDVMSCPYGTLPAHAGMWRAAEDTADDLMARLAVVPMVLEARGLDVTPGMIEIFRKAMTDPRGRRRRRPGRRGDGGDPCRGSAPRRLWLEMVPLPLRAGQHRPETGLPRHW
jgi:uncharacterized ferritin-like protein (DUF455 family)